MPNDSSTGGFLTPTSNNDLNDLALIVFLQQMVVGMTGLPGTVVFPRWQPEPPNIPNYNTSWAAIGSTSRKRDPYSYSLHTPGTNAGGFGVSGFGTGGFGVTNAGSTTVVRNRILEILCSFYGPLAETNSELFAMGLEVGQNRETMQLAGFNLVSGAGDATIVPTLVKERWLYRVDIPFTLRQQQQYTYPVLDLLGVLATLETDQSTESIVVSPQPATTGFGANGFGVLPFGE
jgi:hypothetical protein